jgi:hypothetical protein
MEFVLTHDHTSFIKQKLFTTSTHNLGIHTHTHQSFSHILRSLLNPDIKININISGNK